MLLLKKQFALTAAFHFLFVPLTIGLIILVVIFEAIAYKTGSEKYKKMSEFWSELFIINYAFGIVTGITMSIQFGTNWAEYSRFMGDIFGSPLALEALIAFFLESTFTGIWIFKRHKISPKFRLITVILIALGTTISAIWIITANGFMQNPVGGEVIGGRMELVSFTELILNPYTWYMFIHNHLSALLLGGFVVIAISSWHLLKGKKEDRDVFTTSIKYGAVAMFISAIFLPFTGSFYMGFIEQVQPDKISAIAGRTPLVSTAFSVMVTLGTVFILLGIYTAFFHKHFIKNVVLQKIFVWMIPLPYIAICAGWIVTEVGRQPWIVYDILKVEDAISNVPVEQVWFSLISIMLYYVLLAALCLHLSIKRARRGIKSGGVS